MRTEFIKHLNAAVEKLNYSDRSKLIRDAIVEKLNREGIETPSSLAAAPLRVGKPLGNRQKKRPD
jgi:metal-responsive CopG/Arc/MetJ family transcriptional regulator